MKIWILVLAVIAAAGCDRGPVPQRQGSGEGDAAQSAAGGSADEGKAVRRAAGR